MKLYEILGYTFDGALYCMDCLPDTPDCVCNETDRHGMCPNNCHGYGPHPYFVSDLLESDSCSTCLESMDV